MRCTQKFEDLQSFLSHMSDRVINNGRLSRSRQSMNAVINMPPTLFISDNGDTMRNVERAPKSRLSSVDTNLPQHPLHPRSRDLFCWRTVLTLRMCRPIVQRHLVLAFETLWTCVRKKIPITQQFIRAYVIYLGWVINTQFMKSFYHGTVAIIYR